MLVVGIKDASVENSDCMLSITGIAGFERYQNYELIVRIKKIMNTFAPFLFAQPQSNGRKLYVDQSHKVTPNVLVCCTDVVNERINS